MKSGAVSGELLRRWIAAEYYPDVKTEELSDEQKSTISALSTLAAGLMGGLSGGSSADAVAGAQAGKNAIENNALSFGTGMDSYANAAASWDQYAAANGLTQEQTQEGLNRIATGEGPSWGTTYKVSPVAQAGGDVSFIRGLTLSGTVDDNHISINKGDIYSISAHGGASIGVSFGPYMPGVIGTPNSDYSFNAGLGLGSVSISAGKDGIGFTFGVGPNWGWCATEIKGVDINGTSTNEVYRHDFK